MSFLSLAALLLALVPSAQGAGIDTVDAGAAFARGVDAYRQGNYAEAASAWSATLAGELDPLARARVYFDLGNARWRAGEPLPAIACYTAAVRLDPRHAGAWENLELARAKAGLPPADAGDLAATLQRLLTSLRPGEARALLFGALVLWALVLVLETRFGGTVLRGALWAASGVLLVAALPWAHGRLAKESARPMLVIATGGASLRGEPLEERAAVGELAVLEEVEHLDELPGWVRVQRADGLRGWVKSETVLGLELGRDG